MLQHGRRCRAFHARSVAQPAAIDAPFGNCSAQRKGPLASAANSIADAARSSFRQRYIRSLRRLGERFRSAQLVDVMEQTTSAKVNTVFRRSTSALVVAFSA